MTPPWRSDVFSAVLSIPLVRRDPPGHAGRVEDAAHRFELQGPLGQGGMGRVLRARDRSLARDVALKLVRLDGGVRRERFQREGELAARLDHPGIVRVHSAGVLGSEAFLVCELVEGARPLDVAFRGVDRARRVAWVLEAARALAHAHARGVVHRDVKPGNVLVGADGRVRVTDFGLARASGVAPLTREGTLLGTPSYAAPEAFDGRACGAPADVWGLGVLLYQALTDELPFQGGTLAELGAQVALAEPRAPRELDPAISPALEAVCLRALARAPERRPADGAAFAAELEQACAGASPPAPGRAGGGLARRAGLVAAGALGAAAALGATLLAADRPDAADPGGPAPMASSDLPATVSLAPPPLQGWSLPRGSQTRSRLSWRMDRGEGEEQSFHTSLELDLLERVEACGAEALVMTLELEALRLDVRGGSTFPVRLHTERLEPEHPVRRVLGRSSRVTLDPRSGALRGYEGLDLELAAIVRATQGATRDVLQEALEPLGDELMASRLNMLWGCGPAGAGEASWGRKQVAWLFRREALELPVEYRPRGADAVQGRAAGGRMIRQLEQQRGLLVRRFECSARWRGGRVVAAQAVLEATESWTGRPPSQLEWALEYALRD